MHKKLRINIVLTILILAVNTYAQSIEHKGRYEIKYEWEYENHLVVSNEERGLTLIRTNKENSGKTYPVNFTHLNSDLEEIWKDSIDVSTRMFLRGYHYLKDRMYVMFQDHPVKKRIKVVSLDYKTKEITTYETSQIAELNLTEFEVIQNTAILGGYFEQRPVVFAYDLDNDRVKAVRGVYKNNSRLLEVRVNNDSVTFNVLVAELNDAKDQTVIVNTYDFEGNPVRDYTLETKKDYSLIDGVSSSINDVSQIVVGNYGYNSITLPSGIYINYIDRRGQQTMKYYNYGELDSFLDYLSKSRSEKVKSKALESKERGKEQRYRIMSLTRELIEMQDKIVLHAEYFKPNGGGRALSANDLRNFDRNFPNGYGIPDERRSGRAFNGPQVSDFDFTHAYALLLSKTGDIIWDDSFIMDYTLEGTLDQHGRFQWIEEEGHMVFAHYDDKEVFAQVLDGTEDHEIAKSELSVGEEFNKRDELESTVFMTRWYGDQMLVHGIQNVRPKDKSKSAERVFFINAIQLDPTKKSDN